jgi:hypothetical protein
MFPLTEVVLVKAEHTRKLGHHTVVRLRDGGEIACVGAPEDVLRPGIEEARRVE